MTELTPEERLQPSLLDRLTDDEPSQQQESREKRVVSPYQLRDSVVKRDLPWLLNATDLASVQDLPPYPQVLNSVVNYGLPDLAGKNVSSLEVGEWEKRLKDIIERFEPRILPESLEVRVVVDADRISPNAVLFEI